MKTKTFYANCCFGVMYLILRGKATKWILMSGGTNLIPFHSAILTKNGHLLNFYRELPHEQNTYGGWWFLGSFKGIRRSKWKSFAKKRGNYYFIPIWIGILIFNFLFILWIVGWSLFPIIWILKWSYLALLKNPCFNSKSRLSC